MYYFCSLVHAASLCQHLIDIIYQVLILENTNNFHKPAHWHALLTQTIDNFPLYLCENYLILIYAQTLAPFLSRALAMASPIDPLLCTSIKLP